MADSASWDPGQYRKFAAERLRPARELLARVPLAAPAVIYDLGCGSGEATRLLAERWPAAAICGIDHSAPMLAAAAAQPSRVRWIRADLRDWAPAPTADLLFANAALHWIPRHAELLPRLLRALAPGGCLALQMPRSWALPSHRLIRETLADGGADGPPLGAPEWRAALAEDPVPGAEFYYEICAPYARALDLWETEYRHVLHGADPVLEWVQGTGLRPVLAALDAPQRQRFLSAYAARLRRAYPPRADGSTLYPFRRLFLVATV